MLALRDLFGFGNLSRVLIVALGLGFGMGAPIDAVQPAGCALVGDCTVTPVEEPRERESLSLSLARSSSEKLRRVVSTTLQSAPRAPAQPFVIVSSFSDCRELRHARGRENLPDKTGPPAA
jgi:hypothetical protein